MTPFAETSRELVQRLGRNTDFFLARRDWRHHGLGMLQSELSDNLRVHVWHPLLVTPEMAWPRCVHDHRFDIESTVVLGEIIDVPCDVYMAQNCDPHLSDWWWVDHGFQKAKCYEIVHAKEQNRIASTIAKANLIDDARLREAGTIRYAAGATYMLGRRNFHTTRVESLTVTVVHRSRFDDQLARILCAPGDDVLAVSGIVRDESTEHMKLMSTVLRGAVQCIEAFR